MIAFPEIPREGGCRRRTQRTDSVDISCHRRVRATENYADRWRIGGQRTKKRERENV